MNFQADVSCDAVPDQCHVTSKRLSLVACWHSPSDFQLGFKRRRMKQSFSPHGPCQRHRYARMWFLQTVGGDCVSFTELRDNFIAIRAKSSLSVDCRLLKVCPIHLGIARGTTKMSQESKICSQQTSLASRHKATPGKRLSRAPPRSDWINFKT